MVPPCTHRFCRHSTRVPGPHRRESASGSTGMQMLALRMTGESMDTVLACSLGSPGVYLPLPPWAWGSCTSASVGLGQGPVG